MKERIFVFFFFTAAAFFAYRNCFDIFIPADNYTQLYFFEQDFISGFKASVKSGALYLVGLPLQHFLYLLFDTTPLYWVITAIILHSINAFTVYLITGFFFQITLNQTGIVAAFFSGLLFLISPYQTENILWATHNIRWLFHASVTLIGMYVFIKYLTSESINKIISIQLLFLLGLFSNEFTIVCPLLYAVFFSVLKKINKTSINTKAILIYILLPQAFLIVTYLIFCKLWSGHWFWHGGAIGDIIQTVDWTKTILKYFAKFFVFYRYIANDQFDIILRESVASFWIFKILFILAISSIAFFFWKLIKNKRPVAFYLITIFICFIISLLPYLSLDSSFLKYIYPDRYGYIPSVFFYIFLASALFFFLNKSAIPVLMAYSILCWILLMQTLPAWSSTNEYCDTIIKNYKPFLKYDRVYVLNIPTYNNGIAAFRSAFAATIFMKYDKSPTNKIRVISGFYQESLADSLSCVSIKGKSVYVTGQNKKTPFFSTGGGWAKSYETEEYKVIFDSTRSSYTLIFKHEIPENSAFIYTSNGEWRKVN